MEPTSANPPQPTVSECTDDPSSMRPFFYPRSVAVVGASRDPDSIGFRVLEALVMHRFQGPVYPVNPKAKVIGSIRAYPSVKDIPDEIDLAVIVVPRDVVQTVAEECAQVGVKALVVITAGFAETGDEGLRMQTELLQTVRSHGMRMVGPNCFGVLNTDPDVRLNATFAQVFPPAGRIGLSSQSGALGLAILSLARRRDLGLSTFVSIGNKADVTGNDLLRYWEEDERTRVILLYLESFGDPRIFARIARRTSRKKPIVAVKGGRTAAGIRAAGSHTAALAASDVAAEALFRQTGVIRAGTLNEMFDLAILLDTQPLPPGRRVAIVTDAGGPGILCADACEADGLDVVPLSEATRASLAKLLAEEASVANPVDMIASAGPEEYEHTISTVLAVDEVDGVIAIYIPVEEEKTEEFLASVQRGVLAGRENGGHGKPVLVVMMSEEGVSTPIRSETETLPAYPFPEAAARALAKAAEYADWRRTPLGAYPSLENVQPQVAREACRGALDARGSGWLTAAENRQVLTAMGVSKPPGGLATSADQAVELAREVGFPVAVKLASHQVVHKTEYGVVRLDLMSEAAVRDAFDAIQHRMGREGLSEAIDGVLVQPMLRGVELMVGVVQDRVFGPLLAFGLGGIHVEVLGDVVFRVTPLTDRDAREMVRQIRGYRLLEGYRGHPPADIEALQGLLLRISRLAEEVPEIAELDLNPLFALEPGHGYQVADARIRVEAHPPGTSAP